MDLLNECNWMWTNKCKFEQERKTKCLSYDCLFRLVYLNPPIQLSKLVLKVSARVCVCDCHTSPDTGHALGACAWPLCTLTLWRFRYIDKHNRHLNTLKWNIKAWQTSKAKLPQPMKAYADYFNDTRHVIIWVIWKHLKECWNFPFMCYDYWRYPWTSSSCVFLFAFVLIRLRMIFGVQLVLKW